MTDYYAILEIDRKSTPTEIRVAYKRMAMLYHPDRNAGDKEAEEKFKQINEAYHVLSDPLKKSRYDHGYVSDYEATLTEAYYHEVRKRQFKRWKEAQQARYYRVDRDYYKVQGLAFLTFLVISGLCFAIIHTVDYFVQQEHERQWMSNRRLLNQANALFTMGEFDKAFHMIEELHAKKPLEFQFNFAHDSLVGALRLRAEREYLNKNFKDASYHYSVLKNYEQTPSLETLNKIASCEYYLGNYNESVRTLKHLLSQQPWNLELIYRLGTINLENADNPEEALYYFTMGKNLFKKNLTEVYGKAFTVIMDPWDVPDIYYYIFIGRAKANMSLKHYDEAITDCNWAVFLRNNEAEGYSNRALVKIQSRNFNDLCKDLSFAKQFGDAEADALLRRYCANR